MAITVVQKGDIPNKYPTPLNTKQKTDAHTAIGALEYAKIFQNNSGTISNFETMRVDMQGTFTQGGYRWHNIQVQINGISGKSTVAHANVSEQTMTSDPVNQKGVVQKVRSALEQSLDSGKSYEVSGSI